MRLCDYATVRLCVLATGQPAAGGAPLQGKGVRERRLCHCATVRLNAGFEKHIIRLGMALVIALCCALATRAQSGHQYLRKGDKQYLEKAYSQAEENYRKALEKKSSPNGSYNLGNAIYQQKRYDDAARQYEEAAQSAQDPTAKAYAYHNQGNAYFEKQDFEKSVEAYKNALRLNPSDLGTKHNLALAQRRLQQMQQQQEQEKKDRQKQEQQQQNQQQQQQQQQNQSQQQPQSKPQQEGDESEMADTPADQRPPQQKEISREEAERLLKIMDAEEQRVLDKLRRKNAKVCASDKDW